MAAAAPTLRRRSGLLAAALALVLPTVAFAYVQRPWWGVGFLVASPLLIFCAAQAGIPFTVVGYYVVMALAAALALTAAFLAFRFARTLAEGARRRWYNRWYHYLWIAAATLALGSVVGSSRGRWLGYEPYRVPATSMQPALVPGDFIAVDFRKSSMADIRAGDIVVFRPQGHPGQTWIKRVVGLPGDAVQIEGNDVLIDGVPQRAAWPLVRKPVHSQPIPYAKVALREDEFFLMGDNRPNSMDSRYFGPVKRDAILGKARLIWFHYGPGTGKIDTARIGPIESAATGR